MSHVRKARRWRWLIWFGLLLLSGCTNVGGCSVAIDHPKAHSPVSVTLPTIHLPSYPSVTTLPHRPPRTTPTSRPATTTAPRRIPASTSPGTPAPVSLPATHPASTSSHTRHRAERSFRWRGPSVDDPFTHFFAGFESGAHAWAAALGAAVLVTLITIVGAVLTTTLTLALVPVVLLEVLAAVMLTGFYGLIGVLIALLLGMLAILLKEMLFLVALVLLAALAGPLGWLALIPALLAAGAGARKYSHRSPPTG